MKGFKNVLFPTEFSELTDATLAHAARRVDGPNTKS